MNLISNATHETRVAPKVWKLFLMTAMFVFLFQPIAAEACCEYNSPLYSYRTKSYGDSYIYAYLNSNLRYGDGWFNPYSFDFVKGYSSTAWMGDSPYNAAEVQFSHEFYFSGVGASISAGSGGVGANLSIDGNTATFSDKCSNCWERSFSHDEIKPSGMLVYRSETVIGRFRFGSSWFSISGYDSDYM